MDHPSKAYAAGMNDNEKMQRCFDICIRLEGLIRHITTHAARIVISNENLQDYLPLYRGRNHELIAQYDYNDLERLGFPGFDLLGLKYSKRPVHTKAGCADAAERKVYQRGYTKKSFF